MSFDFIVCVAVLPFIAITSVSPEELTRLDRLAETIGITQGLRNYFNPILNVVLQALDAPPVFMRTKALKALGQILTSDPTILSAVCEPLASHGSYLTLQQYRMMCAGLSKATFLIVPPLCETRQWS